LTAHNLRIAHDALLVVHGRDHFNADVVSAMAGEDQSVTVSRSLPSGYPTARIHEILRKSAEFNSVRDRGVGGSNPLAPTTEIRENGRSSSGIAAFRVCGMLPEIGRYRRSLVWISRI
ncbi:MAG: hypothetical protein ACRD1T_21660, partial [Acidimicrobiia bacterium]